MTTYIFGVLWLPLLWVSYRLSVTLLKRADLL